MCFFLDHVGHRDWFVYLVVGCFLEHDSDLVWCLQRQKCVCVIQFINGCHVWLSLNFARSFSMPKFRGFWLLCVVLVLWKMAGELPALPQCIDLCSDDEVQVVSTGDAGLLDKTLSAAEFFDFDRSVLFAGESDTEDNLFLSLAWRC